MECKSFLELLWHVIFRTRSKCTWQHAKLARIPFLERVQVQHWYEARLLLDLGGRLNGSRVLEIGCGSGAGVEILLDQSGASQVFAIEIDPRQLRRARRRLPDCFGDRILLVEVFAEHLPFANQSLDAVFDFGVLHHVEAWQRPSLTSPASSSLGAALLRGESL